MLVLAQMHGLGCSRLRSYKDPHTQSDLPLGFLCAFGCQLFDAGLPFAVVLAVSSRLFVVTDRVRAYNMAFVVARIDCQSSKTVKGTPSRSQYVMRSVGMSVKFGVSR